MKDLKMKIKKTKSEGTLNSPDFTLAFTLSDAEKRKLTHFNILTNLIGDSDIIIEVDSALTNMLASRHDNYFFELINSVKRLNLDYRYTKSEATGSSFLSVFLPKSNKASHKVLIYVPNQIWKSEDFFEVFPEYGSRYYVAIEPSESGTALDNMFKMMDLEKLQHFKLIIFDPGVIDNMGIVCPGLSTEDLHKLLDV